MHNASDNVKKSQYFNILSYVEQIAFKNPNERYYISCDEFHLLADPRVPSSLIFVKEMAKRRKEKTVYGMIFITQSLIDTLDESIKVHGQAVLDNTSCKAFMGLDGENLRQAKELYNFTDKESQIAFSKLRRSRFSILRKPTYAP